MKIWKIQWQIISWWFLKILVPHHNHSHPFQTVSQNKNFNAARFGILTNGITCLTFARFATQQISWHTPKVKQKPHVTQHAKFLPIINENEKFSEIGNPGRCQCRLWDHQHTEELRERYQSFLFQLLQYFEIPTTWQTCNRQSILKTNPGAINQYWHIDWKRKHMVNAFLTFHPPPLPQDTTNWHPSQKSKTSNARILGPPTSKSTSLFHGAFVWSGRSELFGLCSTRSCPQNSQRRLEFKHDGIWDVSLFRNSTTFKSTETLHPNKKKRNPPFTRLRYPRGSIVFIHGDLIHRGVEAEKHAQGPAFRVHTYNEPKHLKYIQQDGVEHSDNASQEVCGLSPTNTSPPFTNLRYFLPFGHGNGSRTATPKGANAMQNFPGTTK